MGSSATFRMGCASSTKAHKVGASFRPIPDQFSSICEVQRALRGAGLESSNLILGIDFTKSNTWTGHRSFGGRCLHDTRGGGQNPYEKVIDILSRTMEEFDDDKLIPAFGFGDFTTGDRMCFPFNEHNRPCHGVTSVYNATGRWLRRLNWRVPQVSGPLSE